MLATDFGKIRQTVIENNLRSLPLRFTLCTDCKFFCSVDFERICKRLQRFFLKSFAMPDKYLGKFLVF